MSSSSSSSDQGSSSSQQPSNQSLRWSLQNFPVPLQFQARIPRSPLSVAQELLPNFPSQLGQSQYQYQGDEFVDMQHQQQHQHDQRQQQQQQSQHQFQMSLQQHIQQQLQQQFQRQLQLNLQGGDSDRRGPAILPEPPDDVVVNLSSEDDVTEDGYGSRSGNGNRLGRTLGGISSASSRRLLETLVRSAQAAATSSSSSATLRPNINNNSIGTGGGSHTEGPSPTRGNSDGASHSMGAESGSSGGTVLSSLALNHHHQHGNRGASGEGDGASLGTSTGGSQQGSRGGATPQGLQQAAELTLLYKWAAESGIFVLLLLLHFLYDHRLGLLVFLCLGGTFYYTNMRLVHAIHQSAVREQSRTWLSFLNLSWLCGFLVLNIFILYFVFKEQQLWRILFFQMATVEDISVWTLLWCVVMTDYIIKFLTVISKSLLTMMQPLCSNYRRRGKYYLLMESVSQLYRQVVTVIPWLYYLNDSTRTSVWFAFITEAVYLGFKSWSVWGSIQFVYSSLQRFQSNTSFGTKPSSSDMLERGSQCPICQDSFNEPVMLPCKHIFCEQCVSIWFDREKTCPMCRAEITAESPMWKDGNTSSHLQWH